MAKLLGTGPAQVPTNGDLGSLAYQDINAVNITGGQAYLTNDTAQNYFNDTNVTDVKPSLVLDFANAKALDPRITFTRGSTASYYDGRTTAMAEQNLLTYSQDFTQSAWSKSNLSIVPNSITAPDGTFTAPLITDTGSSGNRYIYQGSSVSGNTYTFSVYLKSSTAQWVWLYNWSGGSQSAYFDLTNGVLGTVTGGTATITSVGSGWYKCTFTSTVAGTGASGFGITNANGSLTYTGTSSLAIYAWGAQLEQRSTVSAYTPTTSSAITNYIPALQTAVAGVARFDHNPTTGESLGLLIEEQRTNLMTYSDQFDNAAWTKGNITLTTNTTVAPDGSLSADSITENTVSSTHGFYRLSYAAGTYTYSIYVKPNGRTQFNIEQESGGNARFTLSGVGTATSLGSNVASITYVGNGWYRCSNSFTAVVSFGVYFNMYNGSTVNYAGDGVSGVFIWGAQLEVGAFPTSYIPTTSSQVTRSADAASMTGTNFSSIVNQQEGTLFVDTTWFGLTLQSANQRVLFLSSADDMYAVQIVRSGSTGLGLDFVRRGLGSITGTTNTNYAKAAYAFTMTYAAASVNGQPTTVVSGTATPRSLAALQFGYMTYPSPDTTGYNGYMRKISLYPKALASAELQEMTS